MRKHGRAALATLLAVLMLCTGCTSFRSIREDSVREDLPQIDPEAGIARDFTTTMYYRLLNEPYLVPIRHSIAMRANESAEEAIVRTLLSGVPPLAENVSNTFPEGTTVLDIAREGTILYVTLSKEFLDDAELDDAKKQADSLLSEGTITGEEYDARIAEAKKAFFTRRRVGLYAIVNSITAYDPNVRVMLSVNRKGTGAERLRYDEVGIENAGEAASGLLEPMAFETEVLATPDRIVECVLHRMQTGELECIYGLFAETESGKGQKPAYEDFEEMLRSAGSILNYVVYEYDLSPTANFANVLVDIELSDEQGALRQIKNVQLQLKNGGNIYQLGFYAFLAVLSQNA